MLYEANIFGIGSIQQCRIWVQFHLKSRIRIPFFVRILDSEESDPLDVEAVLFYRGPNPERKPANEALFLFNFLGSHLSPIFMLH